MAAVSMALGQRASRTYWSTRPASNGFGRNRRLCVYPGSVGLDETCWLSRQFSLIRCFSIASQAASASSNVLKGDPVTLIAPRPR